MPTEYSAKAYSYGITKNKLELFKDVDSSEYKKGAKLIKMQPGSTWNRMPYWSLVEIVRDTKTQVVVVELDRNGEPHGQEMKFRKDDAGQVGKTSYHSDPHLYHFNGAWCEEFNEQEMLQNRRNRTLTALEKLVLHGNNKRDLRRGRHLTDEEIYRIEKFLNAEIDGKEILGTKKRD